MSEFTQEDRDMLILSNQAIQDIKKMLKEVSSDTGFPRCAARAVKWTMVEKHINRVQTAWTWALRTVIGAFVLAVVGVLVNYIF